MSQELSTRPSSLCQMGQEASSRPAHMPDFCPVTQGMSSLSVFAHLMGLSGWLPVPVQMEERVPAPWLNGDCSLDQAGRGSTCGFQPQNT